MSDLVPPDVGNVLRALLERRRVLTGAGALGLTTLILPPASAHASDSTGASAGESQLLSNAEYVDGTQHWSTSTTWSVEESFLPQAVIADGLLRFPDYPIAVSQSVAFDPQGVTRLEVRLRIRRENVFSTLQEYSLSLTGEGPTADPILDPIGFNVGTPASGRSPAPVEWTTVTIGIDAVDYVDFARLDRLSVRVVGQDKDGDEFAPSGPIVDSLELFAIHAT